MRLFSLYNGRCCQFINQSFINSFSRASLHCKSPAWRDKAKMNYLSNVFNIEKRSLFSWYHQIFFKEYISIIIFYIFLSHPFLPHFKNTFTFCFILFFIILCKNICFISWAFSSSKRLWKIINYSYKIIK